jgi:hypothetical protein
VSWRDAAAHAIEAQADVLEAALAALDDVEGVLDHRDLDASPHRAYTAWLRTVRNELRAQARTVRATGADNGFPAPLTVRFPRRPQLAAPAPPKTQEDP